MSKSCAVTFFLVLLGPAYSGAQESGPPPEMAKFDVALGNWEGSGKAWLAPGQEAAPWTSTVTVTHWSP